MIRFHLIDHSLVTTLIELGEATIGVPELAADNINYYTNTEALAILKKRAEDFLKYPLIQAISTEGIE